MFRIRIQTPTADGRQLGCTTMSVHQHRAPRLRDARCTVHRRRIAVHPLARDAAPAPTTPGPHTHYGRHSAPVPGVNWLEAHVISVCLYYASNACMLHMAPTPPPISSTSTRASRASARAVTATHYFVTILFKIVPSARARERIKIMLKLHVSPAAHHASHIFGGYTRRTCAQPPRRQVETK